MDHPSESPLISTKLVILVAKSTCGNQIFFDMSYLNKNQIPYYKKDFNIFGTVFQNNVADQEEIIKFP